jgi:ribosome-binding ATPase YchF (GTP1/OBG family)
LNRAWELLENGKVVYDLMDELKEDEVKLLKGYNFLTFKPFVFAINVGETDL